MVFFDVYYTIGSFIVDDKDSFIFFKCLLNVMIPDFTPLIISIIGILMAPSKVIIFDQITFGLIGALLFTIGFVWLLFYDFKR